MVMHQPRERTDLIPVLVWAISGDEVGENGTTPHLQVAVQYKHQITGAQLLKRLASYCEVHPCIAVMRGTPEQNKKYCSKEARNVVEVGSVPMQGQRTDLEEAVETAKAEGLKAVMSKHPQVFAKYPQGLTKLAQFGKCPPIATKLVMWIWGPSGSGKSYQAVKVAERFGDEYFIRNRSDAWWDFYMGQYTVILDELRPGNFTFTELLGILGAEPHILKVKGGSEWLRAKRIIITSDRPPECFLEDGEAGTQLMRRITDIVEIEAPPMEAVARPTVWRLKFRQDIEIRPEAIEVLDSDDEVEIVPPSQPPASPSPAQESDDDDALAPPPLVRVGRKRIVPEPVNAEPITPTQLCEWEVPPFRRCEVCGQALLVCLCGY
nr:MAG: replication polyprotein [Chemarfal virus 109]